MHSHLAIFVLWRFLHSLIETLFKFLIGKRNQLILCPGGYQHGRTERRLTFKTSSLAVENMLNVINLRHTASGVRHCVFDSCSS